MRAYPEFGFDCDGLVLLNIGDEFQGGVLFYIDEAGKHGLVVGKEDLGAYNWGCLNVTIPGADIIDVGGGLQNDSPNHAKFDGVINSRIISNINILSSGIKYNSAPTVTAEKYYYISTISGSDINFNINFKEFFQAGDPFRIRAYYFANSNDEANQVYSFIESNTFYAFLGNVSLKARAQDGIVNLLPLDQAYWTEDISNIIINQGIYYEAVNFARNAQFTAIMKKSPFSNGERVSIIRSTGNIETTIGSGEISTIDGWQENNSILKYHYN